MSCWPHDWSFIGGGNQGCSKCGEVRRWRPFYERHYVGLIYFCFAAIFVLSVLARIIL